MYAKYKDLIKARNFIGMNVKPSTNILICLLLFSSCNDSPDPTIFDLEFTGITYTDEIGDTIGPIDPTDWLPEGDPGSLPEFYKIFPAYPNPVNIDKVSIHYALPKTSFVRVEIIDKNYNVIKVLVNSEKTAGNFIVEWDLSNDNGNRVLSGIYRCLIEATDKSKIAYQSHGDIWVK